MVESLSIKCIQQAVSFSRDGGGTRCIVQQGQLAERFTRVVLLEEGRLSLAFEDLSALKLSICDHVQAVALVSFLNDDLTLNKVFLFHGVDDDLLLLWIETGEHESHFDLVHDCCFSLWALLDDCGHEVCLLVVDTECLG